MKDKIDFAVGGQAIIEGVMMRSPNFYVMAVRRANEKIVIERRKYVSLTRRSKFWKLPFVRGIAVLYESMKLGISALMFSNKIMMDDLETDEEKKKRKAKKETAWTRLWKGALWALYLVFVFAFALFLFKFLPLLAAEGMSRVSGTVESHYLLFNVVDGLTKIMVFVAYVLLISLLPDVRRVFQYHGAEHQSIWAYEHGKELTVKEAQKEHPEHPRCGTSFIFLVLFMSVVIYTFLPAEEVFWWKLVERIGALPVIAGLSYELLKLSGKYSTHWWMRWVTLPGLWLQKITTKKPSDDMQEVALAALKDALEAETTV